jgi:predicted dehydrogenase
MNTNPSSFVTRREFLKTSAAVAATVPFLNTHAATPAEGATLRLGLVGCGGRGTGAAAQALVADSNVKLVAMGDVFNDRLQTSLQTLKNQTTIASKLEVPDDKCFIGFDAYKQVIAAGVDVVMLATPPHFRPMHLKAAIDAGKHVFAEKPVAVDAQGVRSVLASCEEAKRKNLSVVSGLALRYSNGFRETIKRIHEGAVGDIRVLQANDFRGPIWVKPRQPGWTDMEYHMHNWYYFTWLSGDFNVEQHVHMLDTCSWVMKDEYPVSALGVGGRAVRTGSEYGNIYDHHSVIYEYANGMKLFANCRQQAGTANDISTQVIGSKGNALISSRAFEIKTDANWRFTDKPNDPFVTEHEELLASIRNGRAINNGNYMAKSTLMAIMGRMATYTGQKITWDQAMNSQENLNPSGYTWDATPPKSEIAIPGVTKFI